MTGPELKELLRPVFDFDAKSAVEAYLETVSPKVKEAIKNHHVLVGMNREMVIYAKGRPANKVREHGRRAELRARVEYEEWIYGTPPQDVDFVRFVGDEVVRVETMKMDGQKIVRIEKEVDLGAPTVAKKQEDRPATAPTLRRPGEQMPDCPQSAHDPCARRHRWARRRHRPATGSDPGPNWANIDLKRVPIDAIELRLPIQAGWTRACRPRMRSMRSRCPDTNLTGATGLVRLDLPHLDLLH